MDKKGRMAEVGWAILTIIVVWAIWRHLHYVAAMNDAQMPPGAVSSLGGLDVWTTVLIIVPCLFGAWLIYKNTKS